DVVRIALRDPPDAGDVATQHPGRNAADDGVVLERPAHHRAGGDSDVPPEHGAAQDDGAVADPRPRADGDRLVRGELDADRQFGVLVPVAGVRDEHVLTEPHVVADHDRLQGGEAAPGPDHAPVADHQAVRADPAVAVV